MELINAAKIEKLENQFMSNQTKIWELKRENDRIRPLVEAAWLWGIENDTVKEHRARNVEIEALVNKNAKINMEIEALRQPAKAAAYKEVIVKKLTALKAANSRIIDTVDDMINDDNAARAIAGITGEPEPAPEIHNELVSLENSLITIDIVIGKQLEDIKLNGTENAPTEQEIEALQTRMQNIESKVAQLEA